MEIIKMFTQDATNEIVSFTSRPPREGEVDGKNYHFISKDEFLKKIENNEMFEYAQYNDWYYGTAIDSLDKDLINIGVFNRQGIEQLYNNEQINLFIVQMISCGKTRLLRSLHREQHPDVDEIVRRY